MKEIKTAVIGVGKLGQHHARIYNSLPGVKLEGIVDSDKKQLKKVSDRLGVRGYNDYRDIAGKVDAVSIAVPTTLHYSFGKEFLGKGVHCLIEKPLADKLGHAEELVRLAGEKKVILQVGHIERFNPAVKEAGKYISEPRFIEAFRLGPYDPRIEVGVVLDIMIHDLDIILSLVNSGISDIQALGTGVFTDREDLVKVRLVFENGCVADIMASRVTPGKYRRIRIYQADAYISLNYIAQTLKIFRKKKKDARSMEDIEVIRPKLEKQEPLRLELEHFTECVRKNRKPLVSGEHGRDALELALEILDKLRKHG